jgi:N-acylneuraminate cytidylyltransferase
VIVIVIPAKGASSRLPNKNMAPINGRPMIDYAIDDAQASKLASATYVSTDDDGIAAHAKARGVSVIRRPETLGGEVPIIEVYRHALANMPDGSKVKIVVGLQPDHPDRNVSVDDAIGLFEREGADVLKSTEADGTKNGAHYVLSRHFVDTGEARRTTTIVDDCTNIHFPADLKRAADRLLIARNGR